MAEGEGLMYKVVGVAIGLFVAAILLPPALIQLSNTTGMGDVNDAVVVVLTVLLPILAVIAIAMYFLKE